MNLAICLMVKYCPRLPRKTDPEEILEGRSDDVRICIDERNLLNDANDLSDLAVWKLDFFITRENGLILLFGVAE